MTPSAHTLRGPPASKALPARLLHTLFVFCATSLMMVIAIFSFLLVFLLKLVAPAATSHRSERHVTFNLEPKIVITEPPSTPSTPTLSLTATPRELEPPTPDVAEDPLRALSRICGFLASNSARAWRREDLGAMPPLAGLELYLDAVRVDLERIDEMVEEKRKDEDEGQDSEERATEGGDRQDTDVAPSGGAGAGDADADADTGVDAGAHAAADDETRGLATHADDDHLPPPQFPSESPPSPLPTHEPPSSISISISTSTSTSTITPPAVPVPSTDNLYPPHASTLTITTTGAANPRTRKDAVLRAARPVADPDHPDADADDAAVRAAALLGRFADLGVGLEGTVRERGAALWTALSGRRTPPDMPVPPPPPRTRASAALITDPRDVRVVEASRVVAHQAAWRARFAAYGRLFGPAAEQG
ncbi:hypothetical protein BJV78DRAFT_1285662 [Lactifluus subvellereus]|nr:hypothetical protein BJV78DRAFT_1285662 [Lactifluus subvellereus]